MPTLLQWFCTLVNCLLMNILCLCTLHARRLSLRYGLIWGLLEDEWLGECCWTTLKGTFCFHEFTQHTGTLTEHKTPQKWNSFAHFPPSSHLLPMVRQLQSNEMWDFALQLRLCGCVTFQEIHMEYDSSCHPARPFTDRSCLKRSDSEIMLESEWPNS